MHATTCHSDIVRAVRTWIESRTQQWCIDSGDVGGYYSPYVERGERMGPDGTTHYLRLVWPSSTVTVTEHEVTISGRRGSIEDVVVPMLDEVGHHPAKSHDGAWRVLTTRPDVAWWIRTTE